MRGLFFFAPSSCCINEYAHTDRGKDEPSVAKRLLPLTRER
jgi:hypothetical protein